MNVAIIQSSSRKETSLLRLNWFLLQQEVMRWICNIRPVKWKGCKIAPHMWLYIFCAPINSIRYKFVSGWCCQFSWRLLWQRRGLVYCELSFCWACCNYSKVAPGVNLISIRCLSYPDLASWVIRSKDLRDLMHSFWVSFSLSCLSSYFISNDLDNESILIYLIKTLEKSISHSSQYRNLFFLITWRLERLQLITYFGLSDGVNPLGIIVF